MLMFITPKANYASSFAMFTISSFEMHVSQTLAVDCMFIAEHQAV